MTESLMQKCCKSVRLAEAIQLLKRFAQHELPDIEDANEDDVTLVMGHIDHEHYRHSVRLAKEFLASTTHREHSR